MPLRNMLIYKEKKYKNKVFCGSNKQINLDEIMESFK